jgi:hypothetical protein
MTYQTSPGNQIAEALDQALLQYQFGAAGSAAAVIMGVTADAKLVDGLTVEAFLALAGDLLVQSGRVFRFGDDVVYESHLEAHRSLKPLASAHQVEPAASALLAHIMVGGVHTKDVPTYCPLPAKLIGTALFNESLLARLPVVREYARRPVYDGDYNLLGPGWHSQAGVLVHGPHVEPAIPTPAAAGSSVLQRLSPRLRDLLREFCWASEADLANAVAFLVTGWLSNRFVIDPHPIAILDGNQKGVGKTIFVDVIGQLLDGEPPPRISLVEDDELEKKLSAHVRESRSSIIFLDNVRSRVESAVLERNTLAPVLSFRLLGQSANVTRPNSYLWMITANGTQATADLVSRGLPIRLHFDGDPKTRIFAINPVRYARDHREEILGELAGMVEAWKHSGMPVGNHQHRCDHWASVVGGILDIAGLGNPFLGNVPEVEQTMDEGLADLVAVAEHLVETGGTDFVTSAGAPAAGNGKSPQDWVPALRQAGVLAPLAGVTPKSEATRAGNFLATKINREVEISTPQGTQRAKLRMVPVGSRKKIYFLELSPTAPVANTTGVLPGTSAPGTDTPTATVGVAPPAMPAVPTGGAPGASSVVPTTGTPTANGLNWGLDG